MGSFSQLDTKVNKTLSLSLSVFWMLRKCTRNINRESNFELVSVWELRKLLISTLLNQFLRLMIFLLIYFILFFC